MALKSVATGVGGGGGGVPTTADLLTWFDESATLPNSRVLTAGDNIVFSDSVANVRTVALASGSPNSVLGVAGSSPANRADIVAGTNDRVFRQVAGALDFGQLTAAMFPTPLSLAVDLTVTKSFTVSTDVTGASLALDNSSDGHVTLKGGNINGLTGGGGTALMQGGAGGFTSGDGGAAALRGGETNNNSGGFATIEGGRANGTGIGGSVGLSGGNSAGGRGGDVFAYSGKGATRDGDINIGTGDPFSGYTAVHIDGSSHAWQINGAAGTSGFVLTSKGSASSPDWTLPTSPGYTVAGLPAGTIGDRAYVTDAVLPTFLGTLTGGGSTVCPVFYNGSAWVSA